MDMYDFMHMWNINKIINQTKQKHVDAGSRVVVIRGVVGVGMVK